MTARAFIISAPRSGAGKTTVMLAILAALARQGVAIKAAKSGPDYIDPAFHAAVTGSDSFNLDSWAMPPSLLDWLVAQAAGNSELLVIEGAMGLFDGVPAAEGRSGSAADLAIRWGLPVVLVLDVAGQSQTAAAVARGLAAHHPAVRIAGVVLNRVGSARHGRLIADALAELDIAVFGAMGREPNLSLPERHLGLVQASEQLELADFLRRLGELACSRLDLQGLLRCAGPIAVDAAVAAHSHVALDPPGQRIAVASDAAFGFSYPHIIAGWRQRGAEVVPFSPLNDEAPAETCDCCWLPGGYPELYAARITAAGAFLAGLRRFAQSHLVHGECGGYIVLGQALQDADGQWHPMAGLLGHSTSFARRRLQLGYRCARPLRDSIIGSARSRVRGHEFHYVTLLEDDADEALVELTDAQGKPLGHGGSRRGLVSGTFFHAIAQDRG